jgi:predicted esterase
MTNSSPHQNQPVITAGKALKEAGAALVLIHGRGDNAENFIMLANELYHADLAYLAPQAAGSTWYPFSFLASIEENEPGISSGIAAIGDLLAEIVAAGIPNERIMLAGFSQGACLALEFIARSARRYGGVLGYSGGLIGPDETPRNYAGSLEQTPVFLGCSDVDFHIPKERVELTAQVLEQLGGQVTMRLYPNMGHTINQDELKSGRQLISDLLSKPITL